MNTAPFLSNKWRVLGESAQTPPDYLINTLFSSIATKAAKSTVFALIFIRFRIAKLQSYREQMLSLELIEQVHRVRKSDHAGAAFLLSAPKALGSLPSISQESYFTLVGYLLETADALELKSTTKYMAKKYLDMYLEKSPSLDQSHYQLLAITCLRTATKFNQVQEFSEGYTIDACLSQSEGRYTARQFQEFELVLYKALNYSLRVSTPYDYLVMRNLLPDFSKAEAILNLTIDLALTFPQLGSFNAEAIYFGCLLYCCESKRAGAAVVQLIERLTFCWGQAKYIANLLAEFLKL